MQLLICVSAVGVKQYEEEEEADDTDLKQNPVNHFNYFLSFLLDLGSYSSSSWIMEYQNGFSLAKYAKITNNFIDILHLL